LRLFNAASVNSLEQSSIGEVTTKDSVKPTKSVSSSSMSTSFQRAINTLRTSGGKSGLGTIGHSMGKQLQKLNHKMLDTSDAHSVCSTVTSMSAQSSRLNGSAGISAPGFTESVVSDLNRVNSIASLCIFGEKHLLKSLRSDQLPSGCVVHSLELHEVKHVKASFKKLLRVCSPSSIARSETDQGFLQQLQASEWMRQLQNLLSAANEMVHCVHQRRCSALLCLEDGTDLVPQIVSIAQLCLDPHYRTFAGFRVLIEKEWLAFGHRFSYRGNHTAASLASGFAPIFLQFLDLVHQLLHQYPMAFEFNQYYLKFVAYHCVSGRFRTFLLDNECERAEYGWLYEDLRKMDEEYEFSRENRTESFVSTSNTSGPTHLSNSSVGNNVPIGNSNTYHPKYSSNNRPTRAMSMANTGINYIGTSFWDYAEALWNKSAIFFNFAYVPSSMLSDDPLVVLRPSSNCISLRLWDYYTNEELSHGPSYDFEMVTAEKQRREEVEATSQTASTTPNSRKRIVVNPLYDSIPHFQPNAIEEMLDQIRQLQIELGHPVHGWSATWDKLEIPMSSTAFVKQKEVDRQISVSSQILRRYNLTGFNNLSSNRNAIASSLPVKLHRFEKFNYSTPVSCDYCKKLLWDLVKNGMKCSDCGYNSHEKCYEFVAKTKCEPKELKNVLESSFNSKALALARAKSSAGDYVETNDSLRSPQSMDDESEEDEDDEMLNDESDLDEEEEDDEDEEEIGELVNPSSNHLPRTNESSLNRQNSHFYRSFLNSTSSCTETQTHAGYLCKKGALLKGWKQSWFVLDSNKHQLRYYENKDLINSKGFIDLAEVISVVLVHNEANTFEVRQTFFFRSIIKRSLTLF
jgi:hypothetical protein